MFMSRAMRSVFEIEVGDLVVKLETKNSTTFSKLGGGLNKEVKEKSSLVYVLVDFGLLSVLVRH